MSFWVFKGKIQHDIENMVNEARFIFQHMAQIFLRESKSTLHIYGSAMYKLISYKCQELKITPGEVILGNKFSWRHQALIEEDMENVFLLEMRLIDRKLPEDQVFKQVTMACSMILTVHHNLILYKKKFPNTLSTEMSSCSSSYENLVSKLFMLGSGENSVEELRDWLFSRL